MTDAASFGDFVQPFQIEDLGIRGRLVRLGAALDECLAPHDHPAEVAELAAETLALAATLASGLKYDGVFTLQAQGNGPVGLTMADVTSDGDLRGWARLNAERAAEIAGPGGRVPKLLGAGHMAFTVDQGPETERYQGITELTGATLADCAQAYFRDSEQLDTALVLAADAAAKSGRRAAALMVQRLPGAPGDDEAEEAWRRAVVLLSSISRDELLDAELSASGLLYRLYHEDGVRLYSQSPLRHRCRCSRQRVERTLASFPAAEIEDMADDGRVTVTCEFCKTDYVVEVAGLSGRD